MEDLNDLIPPGSGWTLEDADSINWEGKIVGTGHHGAEERGFLLTPYASMVSANPCADDSLPRTRRNIARLTFSGDISAPGEGAVLIQEMLPGGGFGPEVSGSFAFGVGNTDAGLPRILRIWDDADTLANQKWYAIRNTGGWIGVKDFEVQYVVQMGDANNDGRVQFSDLSYINAGVPTDPAHDDDRKDINGDGKVLLDDVYAANTFVPADTIPKPSGH